jgi:hypothetical protein
MSQFYVTLPSDSSVKVYPDNTVAHYTTKLAQRIHLVGDYEVAITEFIYPNSWLNFNQTKKIISIFDYVGTRGFEVTQHILRDGYYATVKDLIKDINTQLNIGYTGVAFDFNEASRKVNLEINSVPSFALKMNDAFKTYFGFKESGPYRNGRHTAEQTFDLNVGLHLMYIYSDIASFSFVGDTMTPLLRVCNTSGSRGDETRITFTHPQYIPVAHREFETIEININNELGKPMPFISGKSVVTLHFRRRNTLSS